jgi:hypothetical protein
MDAQLKAQWLDALRSGKYPKTTGALRRVTEGPARMKPVGYCCLGVLLDIAGTGQWGEPHEATGKLPYVEGEGFSLSMSRSYLTDGASALAELDRDAQGALAQFNDDHDTFAPVADFIEENIP